MYNPYILMSNSPYLVTDYEAFKEKFPLLEPCSEPDFNCTWSVENVDVIPERNGMTNIIDVVHISVTRDGAEESFKMPVKLASENVVIDSFIEFNSINNDQVIGWVKSVLTSLRQDFVWDCEWAAPKPKPTTRMSLAN